MLRLRGGPCVQLSSIPPMARHCLKLMRTWLAKCEVAADLWLLANKPSTERVADVENSLPTNGAAPDFPLPLLQQGDCQRTLLSKEVIAKLSQIPLRAGGGRGSSRSS